LPGEAAEFFVDSPRQILAALAKRKFILVQKGSGSCCVTPAEVVRSELRELRSAQADPRGQSVWHHVENLCWTLQAMRFIEIEISTRIL
jgi:hypothetical protein